MIYDDIIRTNKPLSLEQIKENCNKEFETFAKILESAIILETVTLDNGVSVTHLEPTNLFKSIVRKVKEVYEKLCAYLTEIKSKMIDKFNKSLKKIAFQTFNKLPIRDDNNPTISIYLPVLSREMKEIVKNDNIDSGKVLSQYNDDINEFKSMKDKIDNIEFNINIGTLNKTSIQNKENIRKRTSIENYDKYTKSEKDFLENSSNYTYFYDIQTKRISFSASDFRNNITLAYKQFNIFNFSLADMASEIYSDMAEVQRKMHQALTPLFKIIDNSNSENHSYNLDTIVPIKNDLTIVKKILNMVYGIYKAIIKCTIGNITEAKKMIKANNKNSRTKVYTGAGEFED